MDDILRPSCKSTEELLNSPTEKGVAPRLIGLSLDVGSNVSMKVSPGELLQNFIFLWSNHVLLKAHKFVAVKDLNVIVVVRSCLNPGLLAIVLSDNPVLNTLVPVATQDLSNEEVLLNYTLSNAKKRLTCYTPVDEEEDWMRWSQVASEILAVSDDIT